MKKIIALACTITCILGLTACGSEVNYTEYEQEKMEFAKKQVTETMLPLMQAFMDDANLTAFDEYTPEELEYIVSQEYSVNVEGNAMFSAITSFNSTADAIGTVVSVGEPTAEIDDDTIIVLVPIKGALKDAEAEFILSNDMFMVMQSAALNEEASLGDALVKAALNTLLGMGTVFVVLIIIICVISLFAFIPKIQAWFSNRKKKEDTETESVETAEASVAEEVDATDDLELVAVIAAAIAASEGAASTDGFVVRSIRKVNRRK